MDEEFVKKVLGQAMAGEKAPENATELWNCYKRFIKDHQPEMLPLTEQYEDTMKKTFLFGIDIFLSIPKYLNKKGLNVGICAMVMIQLERDIKAELRKLVDEEKKKS